MLTPVNAVKFPLIENGQLTGENFTILFQNGSPAIGWVYWRNQSIGWIFRDERALYIQSAGPETKKAVADMASGLETLLRNYTKRRLAKLPIAGWQIEEALNGRRVDKYFAENSDEEFAALKEAYNRNGCFTAFSLSLMIWLPMAWMAGCF